MLPHLFTKWMSTFVYYSSQGFQPCPCLVLAITFALWYTHLKVGHGFIAPRGNQGTTGTGMAHPSTYFTSTQHARRGPTSWRRAQVGSQHLWASLELPAPLWCCQTNSVGQALYPPMWVWKLGYGLWCPKQGANLDVL